MEDEKLFTTSERLEEEIVEWWIPDFFNKSNAIGIQHTTP